jgi:Na+-driven multidrug efflux pump
MSMPLWQGQPSYRRVMLFALPLAISGIAMTGESPVVNAGVSRLADPERGLAGFGVAMSVAWLLESPIVMMLDASTARASDRRSFAIMRRYALTWCWCLMALGALVAFTPLSQVVFRLILGVDADVADAATVGMAIFLPWPLAIAWRRLHQGVLIRHGHTRIIGYAVGVRLTVVTLAVGTGVAYGGLDGTALGALALVIGVCTEASIVWLFARRVVREELPEQAPAGERAITSVAEFHRYYLPLAGTMVCFFLAGPIITAGLARGASPTVSLAAWPVAYALVMLVGSPMNGMQQVAVRLGYRPQTARLTRRFLSGAGILFSVLLLVLNAAGGTRWLMGTAIGAPASVIDPAMTLAWILVPMPLLTALRSLFRGILIAAGRTGAVQVAILLNVVVLGCLALGVARLVDVRGYVMGGLALILALSIEVAVLVRAVTRLREAPRAVPAAAAR